jgi:hypothetical protein
MPVAAFGPSVGSIKRSCHTRRLSLKIPLLVFLTFDRDFLTGLVIKVDFFPALFLDQLITRQILLHLIPGDDRSVLGGLSYRGCGLSAVNRLGWGLNSRRGRGLRRALLDNGPLVINVNYPLPGISPDGHGVGPGFVANHSRNKSGVGNVSPGRVIELPRRALKRRSSWRLGTLNRHSGNQYALQRRSMCICHQSNSRSPKKDNSCAASWSIT